MLLTEPAVSQENRATSVLARLASMVSFSVVLVLVLSGCIRAKVDARVSKDGMVSGVFELAIADQMLAYVGQDRATVLREVRNAAAANTDAGVTVTAIDTVAFVGERITFEGVPSDRFGATIAAIARTAGPFGALIAQDFELIQVKNRWRFTGTVNLSPEQFDLSAAGGADPALPAKLFEMSLKLTFPGPVVGRDKSAKVKGRSITWTPKLGKVTRMQALARTR